MQFLALSAAFLAAVATAEYNSPRHFHHRRQMNATVTDTHTTLTVFQTQVYTVTSCAPTITDCPARSSAGNGVITDTVAITTTVCPITAAEAVKSSILSAVGGSSTAVANAPPSAIATFPIHLSTGVAAPVGGSASSGSPTSDATLTYTLGSGSSTSVITTTIKHTTTEVEYITQYVTRSSTSSAAATTTVAGAVGGGAGAQPGAQTSGQAQPVGGETATELTTTITSSSTLTRYVTVQRVTTTPVAPVNNNVGGGGASAASSGVGSGSGSGSGSGNGGCSPVTVTIAMSTVTVTYTPMAASPAVASSAAPVAATSIAPAVASSVAANGYEISPPAAATPAAPSSTSSTISSGAAPYGNGTEPCTDGHASGTLRGVVASTGFLTVAKPTASMYGY